MAENIDGKGQNVPMIVGDNGCMVPLFLSFFAFRDVWPLWFSKNLIFGAQDSSIFANITNPLPKSLDRHRTL